VLLFDTDPGSRPRDSASGINPPASDCYSKLSVAAGAGINSCGRLHFFSVDDPGAVGAGVPAAASPSVGVGLLP